MGMVIGDCLIVISKSQSLYLVDSKIGWACTTEDCLGAYTSKSCFQKSIYTVSNKKCHFISESFCSTKTVR